MSSTILMALRLALLAAAVLGICSVLLLCLLNVLLDIFDDNGNQSRPMLNGDSRLSDSTSFQDEAARTGGRMLVHQPGSGGRLRDTLSDQRANAGNEVESADNEETNDRKPAIIAGSALGCRGGSGGTTGRVPTHTRGAGLQ